MNNELKKLLNKALEKAKQDLNNEKVEVNYTPEFLIELLEEIKEVANAKPKSNKYEVKSEWSDIFKKVRYYIYIDGWMLSGFNTQEEAEKEMKEIISSREEVANV